MISLSGSELFFFGDVAYFRERGEASSAWVWRALT